MATFLPINLTADEIRSEFERRAGKAKTRAWRMAVMYAILRKLGIGALTWAVAELLGGFLSHLRRRDYLLIGSILCLEGLRIFVIQTVTDILHKDRFRESSVPHEFKFLDRQKEEVNKMSRIWHGVSVVFSFLTFICSAIGYAFGLIYHGVSPLLFYGFVGVIALLAILHVFLRNCPHHSYDSCSKQNSLMYFYDEVYRTAIKVGLGEGDRLEILEFAFTKLASDFRRNIRPPLIRVQNKDLICYLYHNQQGIAMVCEALKSPSSSNVWHQVVAANLPGFWVDEERIELQLGLFWALGGRLHGAGKDAEGALSSIQHLALSFATNPKMKAQNFHPFLLEDPAIEAGRSCIVSRLVRLVCRRFRPTVLFQIRALEACCQSSQVVEYLHRRHRSMPGMPMPEVEDGGGDKTDTQELYEALNQLLNNNKVRAKVHVISTWVSLLSRGQQNLGEDVPSERMESFKQQVQTYPDNLRRGDTNKPYIWLNEVLMAEGLRKILGMTERCLSWEHVSVRSNTDAHEITDLQSEIDQYLKTRFQEVSELLEESFFSCNFTLM